jgi:hypothetical protein
MSNWTAEFKSWLSQPFSEDMPASHWFLFIGLLIVIVALWNVILFHLFEAIRGD